MGKVYQYLLKKCPNKRQLAKELNPQISASLLYKLQSGDKNPSLKTLNNLAAHYNVTVSYLLREKEISDEKPEATNATKRV